MRLLLNDGVKYYKIGDAAYYAVELFQNEELLAYLNDNAIRSEKSPFDGCMPVSHPKLVFLIFCKK